MAIQLQVAQVLETWDPTQFNRYLDKDGLPHPPGTIRVRIGGTSGGGQDLWAYPADPNRMPVPLYGEQVLIVNLPDGKSIDRGQDVQYYICSVNTHGNVNNGIMPFLQDSTVEGATSSPGPIAVTGLGKEPKQISFKEKDVTYIQPFQGDINLVDRAGSILRFSATHSPSETMRYLNKPFWTGTKAGDPFVSLTAGVAGARSGRSLTKYYTIEDPMKDPSYIYMTTSQKFNKFTLAQPKLGTGVDKMNVYTKPQVVIGSDRLIFNAKQDEVVLVSNKDVKIATPKWQADMDMFFTQVQKLIDVSVKLAEGSFAYATPAGPTGPSSALGDLKKIQSEIKKMQQ